ncbi:MAG: ABC transporter permease [Silanimonas sp.]|nr:MAG: ABC transporter permease [Silanimonas sp.]GIX40223.1 MAG: ABC transporter permease [Silanimonas sp.]
MNTFPTLLKREFWEHKGGMLWAPVVVGGLLLLFALGSLLLGLAFKGGAFTMNGEHIVVDGQLIDATAQAKIASGMVFAALPSMAPLAGVLALVLFFYALGSLYDERKDRSVLFWKSMPVSDTATVLSKLASMLVVAPLITALIGGLLGVVLVLAIALAANMLGTGILGRVLATPDLYLTPLAIVALVPVYALWVLPSIAWCMAVSAWARRAPFLWAVGLPLGAGVLLSWQEAMFDVALGAGGFWKHVVGRFFGSFIPGLWFAFDVREGGLDSFTPGESSVLELVAQSYASLSSPALWIGLAVGAVLIALAIRLRRWREDAS